MNHRNEFAQGISVEDLEAKLTVSFPPSEKRSICVLIHQEIYLDPLLYHLSLESKTEQREA